MAEVICVGSAVLDQVYEVPALTDGVGTLFAYAYRQAGAGLAANAAVGAARLGGSAVLWTRLGDDETGDLIIADLQRRNVDTAGLLRVAGAQSPLSSVVASASGQRQTTRFDGVGLPTDPDWLPLARLQDTSAVLAEPHWQEGATVVLEQARDHRLPGILAIGETLNPTPVALARTARYVLFAHAELHRFSGENDTSAALVAAAQMTGALVGVTSGYDGFRWCEPDGAPQFMPPPAIDLVDPAASWDSFCGAFALAIGEEKSLETAIAFAITTAGLTSGTRGGRSSIPDRRTVWSRLAAECPDVPDADG